MHLFFCICFLHANCTYGLRPPLPKLYSNCSPSLLNRSDDPIRRSDPAIDARLRSTAIAVHGTSPPSPDHSLRSLA